MNDSTASATENAPTVTGGSKPSPNARPHLARRRYLIDRRRQLRTVALTSGVTIFLLTIVNIAFGILRTSQSMVLSSAAPQLKPILEKQDANFAGVLALLSAVFVIGVAIITIAETHRTAGAIFAVKQRLDRVRDGDLHATLKLRERDTLQNLVDPFNEMVGSLRHRALSEADELDRLADDASSDTADPSGLAARIRELADRKRTIAT